MNALAAKVAKAAAPIVKEVALQMLATGLTAAAAYAGGKKKAGR